MAVMLPSRSRISHLVDAVTLGASAAAVLMLALAGASALGALGILFVVPLIVAAALRILRGLHFALTGRELRVSPEGQMLRPPARLGRPSWERQPDNGSRTR